MNDFKLIANKVELDLFEGFGVDITKQIEDILDTSKRKTDFTKTIEIPSTPKNDEFFKYTFDNNIDNINFNINKAFEATIRIGENEIISGSLQLINILNNNDLRTYEVILTGRLKSLVESFAEHTLSSLDLSRYNHIRNKTTIISSLTNHVYINDVLTPIGENGIG